MQVITIELLDKQALSLINQLEKVQWVRILNKEDTPREQPSLKLGGSIAPETAKQMQEQLKHIRDSWERDIS